MKNLWNQRSLALSLHNRYIIPCAMKKTLLIVFILLCSGFMGINHNASASSGKADGWVDVDKISTTIEVNPMSSYYFHIENSGIDYVEQEKIPVMDALKRVPNWLRDDLENNFEKMAYVNIDIGDHAAPTAFDIDNDNDFDLVVGRSDGKILIYENSNSVWIKKGFLNDSNNNPINVGAYAVLTFFDLYNDGDDDLIVGSYDGKIRYYENTTEGFVYKGYLKDVNGNTIKIDSGYSAPAFGWIVYTCRVDDPSPPDDFEDMLIGAGDGKLYRYERTYDGWIRRGTLAQDSEVEPPSETEIIDVGDNSKPALVNLNKGSNEDKGDDLTIGAKDGSLHFYWNIGNRTVRYYDPVDKTWYDETRTRWSKDDSVYEDFEEDGYSAPSLADLDRNSLMNVDCLIDVVVGRGDGHIHLYKNVGSSSSPEWDVFPYAAEPVDHHMKYRNLSYVKRYIDLILDVENEYVDEIGFCIAHTSPDVLTDDDVYLDVFKRNAELIYEINASIQYANLVEEGDYSTGDYWTTIEYYTNERLLKLPPDIYYWFVVHPKITDEIPTFINPETGSPDEDGVFWREYLFYYADENYPPDPDVDDNNDGTPDNLYPREEKPPLLKDKIANVTLLYDSVSYSKSQGYNAKTGKYDYPEPRTWEWSYTNHPTGVEIVSNWVKRTLPLSESETEDGERPIQPVRIAHHHNGRCGELQDLTVAAARTCLIPAAGVCLHGEDHVWAEFYSGDSWHQWDNQWGDKGGGSVIDNFAFLGSERGGSGIFKWWGDDHITDVTECYVPDASTVKIRVTDAAGWAVDGAKVVVSIDYAGDITGVSSGFAVPGQPLPCIWNYTNSDGICEFRLADHDFKVSVKSKLGSADEDIGYIGSGGSYEIPIELSGTKPRPEPKIGTTVSSGNDYEIEIDYEVMYGEVNGENQWMKTVYGVPNEHPKQVSANIDFFTCTKKNMEKYLKNEKFKYDQIGINQTSLNLLSVDIGDDTYIVFSNDDSVEMKKIINVIITLKKQQYWNVGIAIDEIEIDDYQRALGIINITGTAYSELYDIENVWIRVDTGAWQEGNGTADWKYEINTTEYYSGEHTVYARAWDGECYALDYKQATFPNDLPVTNILSVHPISDNNMVQGFVSVNGTVSSVKSVQEVKVRIGDINWDDASDAFLEMTEEKGKWNWHYDNLDTSTVDDGGQKIYIRAFNGIMYTVESVEVIVDNKPPDVNILSVSDNDVVSGSVTINGNASDVNGVKKIWIKIDEEDWAKVGIASLPDWDYWLDTTNRSEGKHTIYVSAFDGLHYHNISDNITVDNNRPPEIICSPTNDSIVIKENSTQTFEVVDKVDPEGNISAIKWYLDDAEITACANQTYYKFVADYDSSGSYQIKVEVWDDFWDKEAKIRVWNLMVENVNRAPVVQSFTPSDNAITINEGENKTFSVISASDPDGTTPVIAWYLDGVNVLNEVNSYTYKAKYDSSGNHVIKAVVSDNKKSISHVWILTVKNVNQPFTVDGFSPNQNVFEMKKGSVKTFSVVNLDDPENNLTIKWYLNGEFMTTGKSCTFIPESGGIYLMSVTLSDGNKTVTNQWTVNVKEPEPTPGFELLSLIVLSLIVILGALIVLRKIKRRRMIR